MFHIAAFYRFADLPDFELFRDRLVALGAECDVKGTVLLAPEGVNGTIAGPREEVEAFLDLLQSDPRLSALEAKWSTAEEDPFLRLKVRLKKEIVTLRVGDVDSINRTATHVPASEWNELISDPDTVVIDTRNDYEYAIGTFANAVNPETRRFGEFPAWIESQPDIRSKKLAMFCTGGIRCEKGTAYLREQGFEDVFQLEGGILKYLETVDENDSLWDGECYVFDRRVSVGHGLVPGDLEICPNCNTVLGEEDRARTSYRVGVHCGSCHDTITEDRMSRFAERQHQVELAERRGSLHLGQALSHSYYRDGMTEIYFTNVDEANDVLAENHFALLVGMTLYQQVPVEKAFSGPAVLEDRLGESLDAGTIAAMDPQKLEDVFREKPALHRFPANMAKRTQAVAGYIVDEYDGDPAGLWDGIDSGAELLSRIRKMPGFGDYKARVYAAVLAQQFGIKPDGWEESLPEWPNISEVSSEADRTDMKERKKAWKASQS